MPEDMSKDPPKIDTSAEGGDVVDMTDIEQKADKVANWILDTRFRNEERFHKDLLRIGIREGYKFAITEQYGPELDALARAVLERLNGLIQSKGARG